LSAVRVVARMTAGCAIATVSAVVLLFARVRIENEPTQRLPNGGPDNYVSIVYLS
jgi:hypothetical protein